MRARWHAAATAALTIFGLAAAAAPAATVDGSSVWRVDINRVDYTAAPGEVNRVVLGQQGDHARLDDPGALITSTDSPLDSFRCLAAIHTALCDGLSQYFTVNVLLGDGNDSVTMAPGQQKFADGNVDGGPGNDDLRLPGFHLVGGPGADDLGGPGARVSYELATGPVSVTLDGRADDGAPGEGDNVRPGVSAVWGGAFGDHLSGDGGATSFFAGAGDDVIDVRDGADDFVACGDGADSVSADAQDTVAADCETVSIG